MLKLGLMGHFQVNDAQGREVRLRSRKARALLAYLALHPDTPIERERLAAMLWDDSDPESARTSLRQALASLRRAFPQELRSGLAADASTIALRGDAVVCDALQLRRLLNDADGASLVAAMDLYAGNFLEDFAVHSAACDEWLEQERNALRRDFIAGLERLARACEGASDQAGEKAALTRLLAIDSANERAHRSLMRLLAESGDHTAALRQYRICREALRRELDVAPDPATDTLYRDIMRRRRADPSAGVAAPTDEDPDVETRGARESSGAATMREAVVLAVRLNDLATVQQELDPEEARTLAESASAVIEAAVERHGGACDRLLGDRLLAVFGIRATRGNEPLHAIAAARELVSELPKVHARLRPAIGLAAGPLLPAGESQVFPLAGAPVGTAIDLMQNGGPDAVWLSDAVRRALAGTPEWSMASASQDRADRTASGWRLEQQVTNVSAVAATPFAGRRPETTLAATLLDQSLEHTRGRTLLVRGEPGIGKSRLVAQMRRQAVERGLATHLAQVLDCGQSEAQRPLAMLAASLLGLRREQGGVAASFDSIASRATAIIGHEDLVFLGELTAARLPEELAAIVGSLDAETRLHGQARVLAKLVDHACTQQPILLIVEDVHWASAGEIARIADLAASIVNLPAMLVLTTRPEDDPCTAPWRARARGCPLTTIDLAPLADAEARELAAHYGELDPALIEDCLRRAEGHPLFLEQLLQAARAGERALPGSVRALALAKIDRLSNAARQTLHAASILGLEFRGATLEQVLADEAMDIAALESAGLVIEQRPGEYVFAHALFRDAVHDSMLATARRELHRRAAEVYGADDLPLRAWHLEQARDPRAAETCLLAARAEHEAHRAERAWTLADSARRLATEPRLLNQALCLIGELALQAGRTHDAIASFREAIDCAPTRSARARPWLGLASALRLVDRYEEALAALDEADKSLGDLPEPAMRTSIWSLRGNLCFPRGELDACLDAHRQAHHYAQLADSALERARALGGLGDAWYQRGRMLSARQHFEQCVAGCTEHGLTGLELAYLPMLACTRAFCGDIAGALREGESAADKARRLADLRSDMLANDVNASLRLYAGQFAEALSAADRTIALAARLGARRFEIEARGIRGLSLVGLGRRADGLAELDSAATAACAEAATYCAPWVLGALAYALEDADDRRAALGRGESILGPASVSHNHLEFYRYAIEVALEEGWREEVGRYVSGLESYTRDEPLPWAQVLIDRARALANFGAGGGSDTMIEELADIAARAHRIGFDVLVPALTRAAQYLQRSTAQD